MMRLITALMLVLAAIPLAADDHVELLNEAERRWLNALERPLIVATEDNYHPYNFFDEQGELSGFVGDYVRLLEERLEIEFEVREFDSFADVLEAARNREVDILPLILTSEDRKSYLDFTQPVYETHDHIFVRQETQGTLTIDDLVGKRLAVVEGYTIQAELEASHPGIEIVLVTSELDGLTSLSVGRVDAFITEIGIASYYIDQEAITNLRIAGDFGTDSSESFGIRSDWPLLTNIIGKGLASITPDERAEIRRRWVSIEAMDHTEIERLWRQGGTVVVVVLLILSAVLVWTFSLRRLVAARTKALEKELAERRIVEADKLRLAIAVEQSAEFVLVINTEDAIEYANLSFRKALGIDKLEGKSVDELTSPKSENRFSDILRVVRESGKWRGQVMIERGTRDPLKVVMAIAPIFGEDSEVDGYVATARDLTKEEELEARVQQNQRLSALGTLAGGIAHDFNNLLVPILGYTDLVRAESSKNVGAYLDGITKASERARDLVQRIMIFGRGGSGELLPLDLRFEVEDSIAFLRSLLPAKIELEASLSDVDTVLADKTQMQQLLLNLCTNASDAMAETGGSLHIELQSRRVDNAAEAGLPELSPGEYAVLTVADSGVGMTVETKARIFDPYFSAREGDGGTGLGLAIVHGIVTRHGGYIHVDSAPGVGTSFEVYLPTVDVEPPHKAFDSDGGIPRGNGETIMLVDDDELVLSTLQKMLQGLGYEISAWSDPKAALSTFESEPDAFAAVLADFTMPGLDGIRMTRRMTDIRPGIPVAILTGNVGALQDYDKEVISKPIPLRELADVLHKMLRASKAAPA